MNKFWAQRIRLLAILLILVNLSCATAGKQVEPTTGPQIYDLTRPFLNFWNGSKDLPVSEKVLRLKKEVFHVFPEFYNARIERWKMRDENPDDLLAEQINEFRQIEVDFMKKSSELSRVMNRSLETFAREFPEMNSNFEVYVIHSLGEMDGGTRQFGEKNYFILGVDGMVKYHQGFVSEVPFFHHELFHVFHAQYLTEEMIFWIALWGEGLATYAAEKLNPQAPIEDLMLSKSMIAQVNQNLKFYWKDLLAKLESRNEKDYEKYFFCPQRIKKSSIGLGITWAI